MTALGDWFRRTFMAAPTASLPPEKNSGNPAIPVAAVGDPATAYVLSPAGLLQCWPDCKKPVECAAGISRAWARWGVNTPAARAIWMAQAGHETGQGARLVENMNYTTPSILLDKHRARACRSPEAKALAAAWQPGQPIPDLVMAELAEILGKPEALACRVYDGLLGNRPGTRDGWIFRGAGGTQTTGRAAFVRLAQVLGLPSPEDAAAAAATPGGAWDAMGLYWQDRGCTAAANRGDLVWVVLLTAGKTKTHDPSLRLGMPDAVSRLIAYETSRLPGYRRAAPVFGAPLL